MTDEQHFNSLARQAVQAKALTREYVNTLASRGKAAGLHQLARVIIGIIEAHASHFDDYISPGEQALLTRCKQHIQRHT